MERPIGMPLILGGAMRIGWMRAEDLKPEHIGAVIEFEDDGEIHFRKISGYKIIGQEYWVLFQGATTYQGFHYSDDIAIHQGQR